MCLILDDWTWKVEKSANRYALQPTDSTKVEGPFEGSYSKKVDLKQAPF